MDQNRKSIIHLPTACWDSTKTPMAIRINMSSEINEIIWSFLSLWHGFESETQSEGFGTPIQYHLLLESSLPDFTTSLKDTRRFFGLSEDRI